MRKLIARATLALTLAAGVLAGGAAVQTAAAPPAAAVTVTTVGCYWENYSSTMKRYVCKEFHNYNWWEELWGAYDRYEYVVITTKRR